MTYACTVIFKTDIETLERAEKEHPEVIGAVMELAKEYMIGHQRYVAEGQVMDFDEYRSEEDYRIFLEKAGPHIARYCELADVQAMDFLYKKYDE